MSSVPTPSLSTQAPDDGVNVSQLNMSIRDPQLNKAIGAITIGVAVDRLGH